AWMPTPMAARPASEQMPTAANSATISGMLGSIRRGDAEMRRCGMRARRSVRFSDWDGFPWSRRLPRDGFRGSWRLPVEGGRELTDSAPSTVRGGGARHVRRMPQLADGPGGIGTVDHRAP